MNSILILLALFSFTLILSNLGLFQKTKSFSFIAIPIAIGILFAPESLIPILPSTREGLSWAIRVALTWLAFLAAIRITEKIQRLDNSLKFVLIFLSYGLFFVVCFFLISHYSVENLLHDAAIQIKPFSLQAFAVALVLTSTLYSSKENPFLLAVFFASLLCLFPNASVTFGWLDLAYPLGIGLIMAVICRLIIPTRAPFDSTVRLTLLGLCTLGTGWAIGLGCLEVLVGLALGWAMAFTHKNAFASDDKLKASEEPVRYVVAFFAGLYVSLNPAILVVGVSFTVIRFFIKKLLLNTFPINHHSMDFITNNLPMSPLALPIVLSLHLSPLQGSLTEFILGSFCIGFIVNDVLSLIVEVYASRSFKKEVTR